MSAHAAEAIARAVLYEGYVLYPYRASSLKNREPCLLGGVVPASAVAGETRAFFELVCLVESSEPASMVRASVRFLQLAAVDRVGAPRWHEAEERRVAVHATLGELGREARVEAFFFEGEVLTTETATRRCDRIDGRIVLEAASVGSGLHRLVVRLENTTALEPGGEVATRTFAAAHALVEIDGGAFVSCIDPAEAHRDAVAACRSTGVFPVLVGEPGARGALLASAFALGDHPSIAPESQLEFCDGAEIDEMLALRVRTMTPAEIAEARALDPRTRAVVDRALGLGDDALARLHGARRPPAFEARRPERAHAAGGRSLAAGDRVRLRPKHRSDIFDLALAGQLATIASVEQDVEGRVFFTVTVDDDPGKDLGASGMPGHRFFFRVDEVEPA